VLSTTLNRYYDPIRRPAGSVRLPVRPVIRTGCSRPPQAGAREGLPSSRAHLLPIPFPLPRGVPRRLHFQVSGAFRGLRRDFSGSALPCPLTGLASRGCRIRLMLRAGQSLPPEGLSTLGFNAGRFPPAPPACYRASWQLPGPDSHRLADTSLRVDHLNSITSSSQVPTLLGTRKRG
jgi:hypothetical protein